MNKSSPTLHALAGLAAMLAATGAFATDTLRHQQETGQFGTAAPAVSASRTITLGADTKSFSVAHRETVTVANGGKQFTWQFYTLGTAPFALASIAPKDFGTGHVRVYVNNDPSEGQSGGD